MQCYLSDRSLTIAEWVCGPVYVSQFDVQRLQMPIDWIQFTDENRFNEKALRETQTLRARRSPPIDAQSLRWL